MTKRLIIYFSIVAALIVIGVIVSYLVFGEQAKDVLPAANIPKTASAANAPNSMEPLEAKTAADDVKILSVMGSAQKSTTGGEEWSNLSAGEYLMTNDKVKTDANSKITLGLGEKSQLELAERTELSVGEKSKKDRRFKLFKGRVLGDYKEKDKGLKIENEKGSATVETDEGIFTVLSTGATIAVATKTGSVDLLSGGERVSVAAGQQSVSSGGTPSRPAPIPIDVMLRVVDPGCRIQREDFIVLKGQTTPGARVSANGTDAEIKPDGRFSVKVVLKAGKNNIAVVTEDASGNQSTRNFPCVTVDPGAPIKKIKINWGLSGGKGES